MLKTTSIQQTWKPPKDTPKLGFAVVGKTSVLCVTCVGLTPNMPPPRSDAILKAVLAEMKNCNKGITSPELTLKTGLHPVLIRSLVSELAKRLLVKKGGKKRHGHTVWVA